MMRKSTHRYIAIAFGVAMLPITAIELLMGGFPAFGVICLAGAKQFYDNSIGNVTSGEYDDRDGSSFSAADNHLNGTYSYDHDNGYNSTSSANSRGEYPYGGSYGPND